MYLFICILSMFIFYFIIYYCIRLPFYANMILCISQRLKKKKIVFASNYDVFELIHLERSVTAIT